ncbi:nucleotidyltransferase domain-containing protein [Pyrofollis japonicus]|uniref:nucleotidyltransferase domain-containing protein n=1 Tax=Pyrofollis japonicus TaxID=3060460 RepID=UPI00295AE74D|nr:nucleotidyltransferase domain-containing protein [Pyrofollis japonicus]
MSSSSGNGFSECVRRVASRWRLRYVVLFGSRGRGYWGPHSDFDLAVKAGRRLGFVERGLLYAELEECLPEGARLDLVFLDDWNPVVAWEALARGKLLYSCGDECLREYYEDLARAIDEVADLEPLIRLFERENRRALAGTSGEDIEG